MQITIEDLSPVEKKVEFELPWADVAPKLDKAYDSLRRGVKLPGFRPGKVPLAILANIPGGLANQTAVFRNRWNYGHLSPPDPGTSDHLPVLLQV